jgi:hypothetical protein
MMKYRFSLGIVASGGSAHLPLHVDARAVDNWEGGIKRRHCAKPGRRSDSVSRPYAGIPISTPARIHPLCDIIDLHTYGTMYL